jgi:type II secretory pathway component GspD/PulD (secretin)
MINKFFRFGKPFAKSDHTQGRKRSKGTGNQFKERTMRKAHQMQIKSNRLLMLLLVLYFWACGLQSGLAQEIDLHWTAKGLVGQAKRVPLGEVLKELQAQSDIDVYVDPQLVDTSVSYTFPEPVETEKALKRMLGPHNTAFVYTKDRVTNTFRILQVKIFAAGKSDQTGLLHLTAASLTSAGDVRGGRSASANYSAGHGQGRRLYGPSAVKPFFQPTPGAFGSTLAARHDGSHGPDYRLNATERRLVYEEIQQDKANLAHRTQRARQIDARSSHEAGKSTYRSQRNDALQAYLNR